ncbi:MAG TPA: M20/M25/M40 family metallo-hydrolase, partial [Gemmatimonadaceae bacterium]|nr:M20/M25/M40 family metallo-hydrolase [Gemmatimonadaceae bacterium]
MRSLVHALLPLLLVTACRATTGAPAAAPTPLPAPALTPAEARLRDAVRTRYDDAIRLLERAVNVPSGTYNLDGVRQVGEVFATELRDLGFETRWVTLPDSLARAGHLVAVHRGTRGPRLLLIGHLDTVFEGAGQGWVREDSVARGAGTGDMKGGDVAMLLALRALADAGLLRDMRITVVMTGDEEAPGRPLSVTRAALVDAARASDIALAFEGGTATHVAIGRRGASTWRLEVRARQAHSSGIFAEGVGYGAVYEGARIIDEFRRTLTGERGLTFNVGLAAGGAHVTLDSTGTALTADGKDNIIPPVFVASGDLRFLSEPQKDAARERMRAIVARSLDGAEAAVTFEDGYPAMPVTAANERLLAVFDATSRSLGYPSVTTTAPERRGAGDVSFVAALVPGIDGLGVDGTGSHSPREAVSLPSLRMSAERAAV